jgi:hypothetical protein
LSSFVDKMIEGVMLIISVASSLGLLWTALSQKLDWNDVVRWQCDAWPGFWLIDKQLLELNLFGYGLVEGVATDNSLS